VHTSTVTVAVIETQQNRQVEIRDSDITVEWYSGSGAGGQHRNKHQNSCRITHNESGLVVTAQTRSRQNSFKQAFTELEERINRNHVSRLTSAVASDRKNQVGSGMRGDKIRTYRFQDDTVQDHRTGKRSSVSQVMKGRFDLLW